MTTVFDGRLHVHYGQAYVFSGEDGDTGEMDACFRGQSNGLVGAGQAGMLFVMTGLHTGQVELRVDVADAEPAFDESWEDCVEVSFVPAEMEVRLVSWGGEVVCALPLAQTDYRVRYEGRGMDAGHEVDTILEGEELVESHVLSFWPASPAPDRIVRQTSGIAAYWHDYAQGL